MSPFYGWGSTPTRLEPLQAGSLLSIKSIITIQKYVHITESYACTLKIFAATIDQSINILISFGICSTPKLSK